MSRDALENLKSDQLEEKQLNVEYEGELRKYRLVERVGEGKTAVAWLAVDRQDRRWVLKFSLIDEYDSHSLESEIARVNRLQSDLVAKIDFFGVPSDGQGEIDLGQFYAIVVEWVDGVTLKEFLADSKSSLTIDAVCQMAKDLCEILKCLSDHSLSHNDLHDRNVMVRMLKDNFTDASTKRLIAIDTGQLKTQWSSPGIVGAQPRV